MSHRDRPFADLPNLMGVAAPRRKRADDCRALDELRTDVEAHLATALPASRGPSDLVTLAMREAVLSPGKRVRPLLLLAAGGSLGVPARKLLDAACALEFVHAASLVLDDLPCMDDARMRRGRPTLHLQFGEDVAALAVVALLSLANRVIAGSPDLPARARAQMLVALNDAIGHQGLVTGQLCDLRPECEGGGDDEADATERNDLKTGALFRAAFEMACHAAAAPAETREALSRCALEIGQAFQLRDDLLDRHDPHATGKDAHQDDGKPTLLALLGADAVHARLADHMQRVETTLRSHFPSDERVLMVLRPSTPSPRRSPRPATARAATV